MEKRRILVVDDSPMLTDMWRMLFEHTGKFDIGIENNGAAVLDTAQIFQPHLILLDVCLGGMNGHQIARELKADPVLAATPVVFLTGLNREDVACSESSNGHMVLSKPIAWENILAIAEQLLEGRAPVVRDADFDCPAAARIESQSLAAYQGGAAGMPHF
jgi:CheY-like chemotaxis protein